MKHRHRKIRSDKSGNAYLDIPLDGASQLVRVSFDRWYFEPPVGHDGAIDIAAAAQQLRQDISGGKLRLQYLCHDEKVGVPIEIELDSREDLEALMRGMRRVFQEGVKRSNTARLEGLGRCEARLKDGSSAKPSQERRKLADRRAADDRRTVERRRWYSPPSHDTRVAERRAVPERRLRDRRAA
jgi:hypothetical protein